MHTKSTHGILEHKIMVVANGWDVATPKILWIPSFVRRKIQNRYKRGVKHCEVAIYLVWFWYNF